MDTPQLIENGVIKQSQFMPKMLNILNENISPCLLIAPLKCFSFLLANKLLKNLYNVDCYCDITAESFSFALVLSSGKL